MMEDKIITLRNRVELNVWSVVVLDELCSPWTERFKLVFDVWKGLLNYIICQKDFLCFVHVMQPISGLTAYCNYLSYLKQM